MKTFGKTRQFIKRPPAAALQLEVRSQVQTPGSVGQAQTKIGCKGIAVRIGAVQRIRVLVGVVVSQPDTQLLAFNDCVIKTLQPRAFSLRFLARGLELKRYYGDGVIISTPAGSTAYSLAAGGPIVEPDLNTFLITPLCPHSLTERPLLVRADEAWEFAPLFKNQEDRAIVSLDGQGNYELKNADRVILRRAAHEAQLICAGNFDFFTRLRDKLEWGERDAS